MKEKEITGMIVKYNIGEPCEIELPGSAVGQSMAHK